jgi:hypothetical protein
VEQLRAEVRHYRERLKESEEKRAQERLELSRLRGIVNHYRSTLQGLYYLELNLICCMCYM